MVRVAAIDCGSNSTRLLISNVENGRLENLLKQHEVTKLSENLIKTNVITDDSKKRFYKVIRKYLKIIENNKVEEVFCIGTAALRNSRNSDEIINDVKSKFKLDLKIISGEEEGYLTGIGVQSSFEDLKNYLIVDIGGQSTELIYDIDKRVNVDSKEIGVVMMNENFLNQNPISAVHEDNAIYIYFPNMRDEEHVIRSILHEFEHTHQDPKKHDEYRALGYDKNPYEIAAYKAEEKWKKYL